MGYGGGCECRLGRRELDTNSALPGARERTARPSYTDQNPVDSEPHEDPGGSRPRSLGGCRALYGGTKAFDGQADRSEDRRIGRFFVTDFTAANPTKEARPCITSSTYPSFLLESSTTGPLFVLLTFTSSSGALFTSREQGLFVSRRHASLFDGIEHHGLGRRRTNRDSAHG